MDWPPVLSVSRPNETGVESLVLGAGCHVIKLNSDLDQLKKKTKKTGNRKVTAINERGPSLPEWHDREAPFALIL